MPAAGANQTGGDIIYPSIIPFTLVHIGCFMAVWTGVEWRGLLLCAGLYLFRMFGVTAGYHRYFSHRSFATSRPFQLVLAVLAQSTAQKSVLWWAAKHRHHHRFSDSERDVHSPRRNGFIYSHVGWMFAREHDALSPQEVPDLSSIPELAWLHRFELVPALVLASLCLALAGWEGLVVGFLWSTVLLYHATFCINSLAHVQGSRRYLTGDDSRNNLALALLTMGEGWHNNHHAHPSSARQGFRWWEVDLTWYILKLLAGLRLVRDLKRPSARVLRNEHCLGEGVIQRTAEQLMVWFEPKKLATSIKSTLHPPELATFRAALSALISGEQPPTGVPPCLFPTRAEVATQAMRMFAVTRSLDVIVEHGHRLLMDAVGRHLATPDSFGVRAVPQLLARKQ